MRLIIILFFFVAGLGVGYYFGFDHGFERAIGDPELLAESAQEDNTPIAQQDTDDAIQAPSGVVGVWQSKDDAQFTREFREDGAVVDRYAGDESATTEGVWRLFMYPTEEQVPFTIQPGVQYLRIAIPEEVLYFSITKVDTNDLDLVYLGLGNTLHFTRIQ